ncbi:hypothetical protein [Dongia sp.]|uniref:hypothetical protein n=1 Tax=Dongia sp. TaxID=1977262 RepID=UPI0035B4ADF3
MRQQHRKYPALASGLVLVLALLAGCAANATADNLWARLTAANLLAGSLAEGLGQAIEAKWITPGSQRAQLIARTLDAAELSLDGAAAALRAGLPAMAERQIGAAETQLSGLEPLITTEQGETP